MCRFIRGLLLTEYWARGSFNPILRVLYRQTEPFKFALDLNRPRYSVIYRGCSTSTKLSVVRPARSTILRRSLQKSLQRFACRIFLDFLPYSLISHTRYSAHVSSAQCSEALRPIFWNHLNQERRRQRSVRLRRGLEGPRMLTLKQVHGTRLLWDSSSRTASSKS